MTYKIIFMNILVVTIIGVQMPIKATDIKPSLASRIKTNATNLKNKVVTGAKNLGTKIKTGAQNLKTKVTAAGQKIKTGAQNLKEKLKTGAQNLKTKVTAAGQKLKANAQNLKAKVSAKVTTLKTNLQAKKTQLNAKLGALKEKASEKWQNFKGSASEKWTKIKQGVKKVAKSAGKHLKEVDLIQAVQKIAQVGGIVTTTIAGFQVRTLAEQEKALTAELAFATINLDMDKINELQGKILLVKEARKLHGDQGAPLSFNEQDVSEYMDYGSTEEGFNIEPSDAELAAAEQELRAQNKEINAELVIDPDGYVNEGIFSGLEEESGINSEDSDQNSDHDNTSDSSDATDELEDVPLD